MTTCTGCEEPIIGVPIKDENPKINFCSYSCRAANTIATVMIVSAMVNAVIDQILNRTDSHER